MPNLNKLAALLAAFCACAAVFSVAASGQNSTTNQDESLEDYRARTHAGEPKPPKKSNNAWTSLKNDYLPAQKQAHQDDSNIAKPTASTAAKPTASTAAKPTTGTAASTTGKREFPGLGDPALWKTADELSHEGRRAELTGDSDTAISKFSKAVIIYQYDPELYYYLGMLYFKRQTEDPKVKEANYDAAEICLRRALKLNRDLWYVWKNLGRISFERKGYQAAIYEYQHAIDCNAPASEVSAEISPYMQSAKYQIQKARKAASE